MDISFSIPLHYAERGVHQCWTCANHISNQAFYLTIDTTGYNSKELLFLLPECKVADRYMLYTTSVPCVRYKSIQ